MNTKIVLTKPRITDYTGQKNNDNISVKWDNVDGIACTGFMRLFSDVGDFDWLRCINRALNEEELEEFSYGASSKLSNVDLVIRIGSPAWFNETDIIVYNACINNNIPFALMSIGVGCKWDKEEWHIFSVKEESFIRIAESEQLKLISCRDPNCYSLFSKTIPTRIEMNGCLGYLCLPPSIKHGKDNVIIEILDYQTLKNNAKFDEEDIVLYFKEMQGLIEFMENNCNVSLMIQRDIFSPILYSTKPQMVYADFMTEENRILWDKYLPNKSPVFCSTYEAFQDLFFKNDVLISGRVHGVLPAAGHGLACSGLGIDMRQFTWSLIPTINRIDIRRLTPFQNDIKKWWKCLDVENISINQSKIRKNIENIYNKQFEYLLRNVQRSEVFISPKDISDEYIKELNSNKKSIKTFIEKADKTLESFGPENSILIKYELDDLIENDILLRIGELTQKYDYIFLLSSKDIKWWDEFLTKTKSIIVNSELANGFRKAIGKEYSEYISVFYCLEKINENIPINNRNDASIL